jgi:NADH:ubiquinone reductase (H+-translocating)
MCNSPKRVLILGGGFAGVYTARHLEKLLRSQEASITLINRENYWVYQPMLPEVLSGSIGLTNVVSPIRRLCPRTNVIMREVEEIDLDNQIVTISPGFRPRQLQLKYDHLVIALGNITSFHGMPGLIENAMPFRTLADAMTLRNHLIHVLEEADVEENPELRHQLLTFVVGGGGFSGVEVPLKSPTSTRALPGVPGTTRTSGGGSTTTARSSKSPISSAGPLHRFANA